MKKEAMRKKIKKNTLFIKRKKLLDVVHGKY